MHQIEKDLREASAEWGGTGNTKNWKVTDLPSLMEQAACHIASQVVENAGLKKQLDAKRECKCP